MNEHQIVKPLRRGESLPPVATNHLMMGCMNGYVHISAKSAAEMEDAARVRLHKHVEPRCPKNHELIVQMLSERKPCREIAESVGVNIQAVQRYIRKHKLGNGMMNNRDIARTNADEIWKLYRSGMHQTVIAQQLGTNRASVNELICGKL